MGEYVRETRECTLDGMRPELASAIRAHIAKNELAIAETDALMCCETTSTKQKKGLFGGRPEIIIAGVMLTPQWLLWASGKRDNLGVLSARLRDIRVQDYETSSMFKMIEDSGINILGLQTEAVGEGTAFIGLGPEPAAQRFRDKLREAMADA